MTAGRGTLEVSARSKLRQPKCLWRYIYLSRREDEKVRGVQKARPRQLKFPRCPGSQEETAESREASGFLPTRSQFFGAHRERNPIGNHVSAPSDMHDATRLVSVVSMREVGINSKEWKAPTSAGGVANFT